MGRVRGCFSARPSGMVRGSGGGLGSASLAYSAAFPCQAGWLVSVSARNALAHAFSVQRGAFCVTVLAWCAIRSSYGCLLLSFPRGRGRERIRRLPWGWKGCALRAPNAQRQQLCMCVAPNRCSGIRRFAASVLP